MQTIGVLLPRSTYYTGMSFDLFEGFKTGLSNLNQDNDVRIVCQNIGFGAEKQQVYRAAEQLLLQENASVVFAYISIQSAQVLRPLFMAANKLLVVLDSGANLPQEYPSSPNVFYHSLHNSLGTWLMTRLANRDGFKNAGMVSGFYDAGYLQTYALAKSWLNQGNNIVFNHVTGYSAVDFTMSPLVQFVETHNDTCLLSIFSSDFAQWYYRDIKNIFSTTNAPSVYVPPFALEETMLDTVEYCGFPIHGVASWSKKLVNEENSLFIQSISNIGREANIFSLLGWEASILAVRILELLKEEKNNALKVGVKLKEFEFIGPRGKVYFHAASNYTIAPLFESLIERSENGFCELKIINQINGVEEAFEEMYSEQLDGALSGWYNSYTCM